MFRKTKMVCTIGPTSCSRENLFRLADSVRPPLLSPPSSHACDPARCSTPNLSVCSFLATPAAGSSVLQQQYCQLLHMFECALKL